MRSRHGIDDILADRDSPDLSFPARTRWREKVAAERALGWGVKERAWGTRRVEAVKVEQLSHHFGPWFTFVAPMRETIGCNPWRPVFRAIHEAQLLVKLPSVFDIRSSSNAWPKQLHYGTNTCEKMRSLNNFRCIGDLIEISFLLHHAQLANKL